MREGLRILSPVNRNAPPENAGGAFDSQGIRTAHARPAVLRLSDLAFRRVPPVNPKARSKGQANPALQAVSLTQMGEGTWGRKRWLGP